MHKDDCIFCRIAQHKAPAEVVYEDDKVIAFKDIHPFMPVHVLVIPKEHFDGLDDHVPEEVLGRCLHVAAELAHEFGLERGYRLQVNTGADGGQTVRHLHLHVLGGGKMVSPEYQDWGPLASNAHRFYDAEGHRLSR
ncbi:MAG: histidine triad nucleotide-binding protein [Atopobiaceae bacterium]|jgi:histidine triad (HIT) family protein